MARASTPGDEAAPRTSDRDPFRSRIALAIVIVSILGALVSWRASAAADRAGGFEQRAAQDRLLREQQLQVNRAMVAGDARLALRLQEHLRQARLLDLDARRLEARGGGAAALRQEARRERLEARTIRQYFRSISVLNAEDNGEVDFEQDYVLRNVESDDTLLRTLRPGVFQDRAETASDRSLTLVGGAAVLVASLFLLTLAQLSRRPRAERFAWAGSAVALVGLAVFVVGELVV